MADPLVDAAAGETYRRLIQLLDDRGATYRVIDHPAEGRTEVVSAMRGHEPADAAKCMIVMAKVGKKVTKYVLAVVPGNLRVNLHALKRLLGATYVSFASPAVAEQLSMTVVGTVLPFSFRSDLELIADPALLRSAELFFNAGRLDRSIALKTSDYVSIAAPRFEAIAESQPAVG
jgi:Ala-tRNA(Pro) deacylase